MNRKFYFQKKETLGGRYYSVTAEGVEIGKISQELGGLKFDLTSNVPVSSKDVLYEFNSIVGKF